MTANIWLRRYCLLPIWVSLAVTTAFFQAPFAYGVQTDPNGLLPGYYNPHLCRFVNADPSGFGGGLNFYAFADGNPVSMMDPFGLGALSAPGSSWLASALEGTAAGDWLRGFDRGVQAWMDGQDVSSRHYSGSDNFQLGLTAGYLAVPGVVEVASTLALGGLSGRAVASTLWKTETSWAARQGPVIIGETMARVETAAARPPGAMILNNMPDFRAMGMQPHEVTSAMMQHNRRWMLEQMRSGRQMIDIGPDPNRAIPSIFYQMEQNMLRNYQKLHPEFNSVTRP